MDLKTDFPAGWRHLLVVKTPTNDVGQLMDLRNFVLESLDHGVLVLPEDCTYSLEALPELAVQMMSSVFYEDNLLANDTSELVRDLVPPPESESEKEAVPTGRNAEEKRAIQARLKVYRKTHGLGCWTAVVKASGGKVSDDQLRGMEAGTVNLTIAEWRLAAKALDKVEKLKDKS